MLVSKVIVLRLKFIFRQQSVNVCISFVKDLNMQMHWSTSLSFSHYFLFKGLKDWKDLLQMTSFCFTADLSSLIPVDHLVYFWENCYHSNVKEQELCLSRCLHHLTDPFSFHLHLNTTERSDFESICLEQKFRKKLMELVCRFPAFPSFENRFQTLCLMF